jgi:hypothetical protein
MVWLAVKDMAVVIPVWLEELVFVGCSTKAAVLSGLTSIGGVDELQAVANKDRVDQRMINLPSFF